VNSVYGKGEIASADTYDKLISNTSSDITQYKSEKKTYDSTRKSARNKLEKELKKNGVSKSERKSALADFDATTKAQVENFNTSIFNAESKLYEYAQSLASLPWDKASAKVDKLSS
jgi:seryl-tRNA synthetase